MHVHKKFFLSFFSFPSSPPWELVLKMLLGGGGGGGGEEVVF